MGEQGSPDHEHARDTASAADETPQDTAGHGATAAGPAAPRGRPERRRNIAAGLIGALALTLFSLLFIIAFIGGLHAPGPRAVPLGIAGSPAQASALRGALDHEAPGGFNVITYPSEPAARSAILDRTVDAALVPGPRAPLLLTASAVGPAVTNATVKAVRAAALSARLPVKVQDIRPLPPSDPDSLSLVYFVVALVTPSLVFGQVLVSRISPGLDAQWQLSVIAVYAVIVAAVATAIADPVIGALTGAPWGIFGIGALLAFAAAAIGAAARRWAGQLGYIVIALVLIPVGISSSGATLGPNMITAWYADLGRALLPGSGMSAVQNTVYFNGNNITTPLLVISAWALAGTLAMVMAAILHPPVRGLPAQPAASDAGATAPGRPAGQPRAAS